MRAGLPFSVLLHAGVAAAVLYAWNPGDNDLHYIPAVPIEVISEAELGEVLSVPEEVKVEEPTEDETPALPEEVEEAPATPEPEPEPEPEKAAEPEPAPKPVEETPKEEPKPEPEPEPKKPEPKPEPAKPASDDLDFDSLADSLKNLDPDASSTRRPKEISDTAIGSDRNVEGVGEGRTLTITEEVQFQAWLERCWTPVTGAPNPTSLVVELQIQFDISAEIQDIRVLNNGAIDRSGNRYWQVSRQRAIAAANECSPFDFLDPGRYRDWQVVTLRFTPPY